MCSDVNFKFIMSRNLNDFKTKHYKVTNGFKTCTNAKLYEI